MNLFSQTVGATLPELAELRQQFARIAADLSLPDGLADDLGLAIAEIGANAICHAFPRPSRLGLAVTADGKGLTAELTDDGGAFDGFAELWAALPTAPEDPLAESGRGLWLARAATDALRYNSEGGNRWSLRRNFRRGRPSILVIEDDEIMLAVYHAILGADHLLTCVRSIAETRALGLPLQFDLIIADFHIHDGTADELLAELDRNGAGLLMPVIIVTGDTTQTVDKAAARLGAHSVLAKPLHFRQTRAAVAQALNAAAAQKLRHARQFLSALHSLTPHCRSASVHGFRLEARMQNAAVGSGDLFLDLGGNDRRRFVLADLMGHGVKAQARAALFSGMIFGLQDACRELPPGNFVNALSRALCRSAMTERLIGTVLVIDLLADGTLELASGGHPAPALFGEAATESLVLPGFLPGLTNTASSQTVRLKLMPGELLAAVTDGLAPEASSLLGSMPQNMVEMISASRALPLDEAADQLERAFAAECSYRPDDDWTLVLVNRDTACA